MSIRIYALAKQLKKGSKELVDVCRKLGIDGKGNSLSSLTPDEEKKISEYFSNLSSGAQGLSSHIGGVARTDESNKFEMKRPSAPASPSGRVPVLQPARPGRLSELTRQKATASLEFPSEFSSEPNVSDSIEVEHGKKNVQDDLPPQEERQEEKVEKVGSDVIGEVVCDNGASNGGVSDEDKGASDRVVGNQAVEGLAVVGDPAESVATVNDVSVSAPDSVKFEQVETKPEQAGVVNKMEVSSNKTVDSLVEVSVEQNNDPGSKLSENISLKEEIVAPSTVKEPSTMESTNLQSVDESVSAVADAIDPDKDSKQSEVLSTTTSESVQGENKCSERAEQSETTGDPRVTSVQATSDSSEPSEVKVVSAVKSEENSSVESRAVENSSGVADVTSSGTTSENVAAGSETEKTGVVDEAKKSSNAPVSSGKIGDSNVGGGSIGKKTSSPLRDVLNRRDNQRRFRDNDASRRGGAAKTVDPRPTRPVPPSFTSQESRDQILVEMKRPPMITSPHGDRVRVFESPRKVKKDENNGASGATRVPKSSAIHLAPMPVAPTKPVKKAPKDQVAQKPEMRLPPEAIRMAARGVSNSTIIEHVRETEERNRMAQSAGKAHDKDSRKGGSGLDGRNASRDDRKARSGRADGNFNSVGGSDFGSGASSRRSKKSASTKDRSEAEGREDPRALKRRAGNESRRFHDDDSMDFYSSRIGRTRRPKGVASSVTVPRKSDVAIEIPCTVKQFAESTGLSVGVVIKKLMELGYMLTLNHSLDVETVELLIVAFELKATVKKEATLEEQFVDAALEQEDPPESLKPRAPVVTFLGHVDHGKTSLLDRILHLHVVSGEKGGITQHIRAYRVSTPRGDVTFVDTPGHEAFTEMRARGANCTDVAVLVVAADDGVMPQTEEAISHAKAAGVPIVVALNKMDLPGVNRDKVVQELATNDLMPSEWGGDVEIVETSAVTGMGVEDLLDTLLTVAELNELKANPNRAATGVVLEASLQSGEGVVCKALVQNGTLHNGDVVLCGSSYGRVRSMTDTLDLHKRIKEAGPSVPVSMVGLDVAPEAGSKFVVLNDISVARQIAEERAKRMREVELAGAPSHVTLENLFERMNSAKSQQVLNVIIRADVRGSIEAIRKELGKLEHPEVKVKILQASVGGVTEADVHLADASDAIIVGFNVVPDEGARALAETKKVQIRRYDVIYKLTDDIRAALEGMLKPIEQVKELGRALVQRAFNISRVGVIAGCRVLYGVIERDCQIRVIRDSRIIGEYQLETLKREKDDVKEVRDGYECGMKLKNFNDIKEGDVLEAYKIEEVARTF